MLLANYSVNKSCLITVVDYLFIDDSPTLQRTKTPPASFDHCSEISTLHIVA